MMHQTRSNPLGTTRPNVGLKQTSQRNALGDISNRAARNGAIGYGLGKKTTKPFSIATAQRMTSELSLNNKKPTSRITNKPPPRVVARQEPFVEDDDSLSLVSEEDTVIKRAKPSMFPFDKEDLHKPQYASEYVKDIYEYHRQVEDRCVASPSYMDLQTDINERMRGILIDWLVEVHYKFKLMPQTLYLTVNTLDRFLERKIVTRKKLQLVGCTAMLLASKYEEIYAPELRDFVYISDRAFTRNDLLHMEGVMLNVLKFNMTVPVSYIFSARYLKIASNYSPIRICSRTKQLVNYLLERTLQEYSMLKYLPSTVAASALFLAMRAIAVEKHVEMMDENDESLDSDLDEPAVDPRTIWNSRIADAVEYSQAELEPCCTDLLRLIKLGESKSLQAVNKKFSSAKFLEVASIPLSM